MHHDVIFRSVNEPKDQLLGCTAAFDTKRETPKPINYHKAIKNMFAMSQKVNARPSDVVCPMHAVNTEFEVFEERY